MQIAHNAQVFLNAMYEVCYEASQRNRILQRIVPLFRWT